MTQTNTQTPAANVGAIEINDAAAQALARKAKALSIAKGTGKAAALIGLGIIGTIGVQKFQARNAGSAE